MVFAHGVGGRADLPLPVWLFAYGAGFTVLIGVVALGMLWPRPRLAAAAEGGRVLPGWVQTAVVPATWLLRAVGLFVYGVVLVAALWGVDDGASNLAPYVVYVTFWVGMQVVASVFGGVWRALHPLDTLALLAYGRRLPERTGRADPGLWPAAAMVLSFAWLALAYHRYDSPRAIGVWLVAYTVAALAGAAVWGRAWLRDGEGFAALFGLLAALSPFHRDAGGRLAARWPVSGLATVVPRRGTDALLLTALGAAAFDDVTRFDWWARDVVGARVGWERTAVFSVGLVFTIAVVGLVWFGAVRLSAHVTGDDASSVADAYVPALVPLVVAYTVAHSFTLLVYDTYNVVALASDPLGRGWDLFGTRDVFPNYELLSTTLVAWVQAAVIVAGHLAAVVVVHDRAVTRHRTTMVASRAQRPLVGAVVVSTLAGLYVFLGAE